MYAGDLECGNALGHENDTQYFWLPKRGIKNPMCRICKTSRGGMSGMCGWVKTIAMNLIIHTSCLTSDKYLV